MDKGAKAPSPLNAICLKVYFPTPMPLQSVIPAKAGIQGICRYAKRAFRHTALPSSRFPRCKAVPVEKEKRAVRMDRARPEGFTS